MPDRPATTAPARGPAPTLPSWWVRDHGPNPVADPTQAVILAAWARLEQIQAHLTATVGRPPWRAWHGDVSWVAGELERLLRFEEGIGMAMAQPVGSAALIDAVTAIGVLHRARAEAEHAEP